MIGIVLAILAVIAVYYICVEIRNKQLLKEVTQLSRGTKTERDLVLTLLKSGVSPKTIFHDLYLKIYKDNYSQIDLIVATKVGLIVFEVKDYSGWIFATGRQHLWTQVLAYGKERYRFYNPIMQNNRHILDLKKKLPYENIPYFSVIVFYGDCVFKDISLMPENTYLVKSNSILDVIDNIKENNQPAQYDNKKEIVRVLREAVENGKDSAIRAQHAENIRNMLRKSTASD